MTVFQVRKRRMATWKQRSRTIAIGRQQWQKSVMTLQKPPQQAQEQEREPEPEQEEKEEGEEEEGDETREGDGKLKPLTASCSCRRRVAAP